MRDRPLRPEFKDYFSEESAAYAEYRPRYPEGLFAWLADVAPACTVAWDAGTGTGQAAVALAAHFDKVIATDASATQLENAPRHPRVEYRQAVAGHSMLAANSVDLATVAQALHWFDRGAFYVEAAKVLVSRGVLAVWCYGVHRIDPRVDEVIEYLYDDLLGAWWTADRRLVEEGYRTIEFPFQELTPPGFELTAEWDLHRLVGYISTWSALRRCRRETGRNMLEEVFPRLAEAWGDPARLRLIRWPLALRVGRVADA